MHRLLRSFLWRGSCSLIGSWCSAALQDAAGFSKCHGHASSNLDIAGLMVQTTGVLPIFELNDVNILHVCWFHIAGHRLNAASHSIPAKCPHKLASEEEHPFGHISCLDAQQLRGLFGRRKLPQDTVQSEAATVWEALYWILWSSYPCFSSSKLSLPLPKNWLLLGGKQPVALATAGKVQAITGASLKKFNVKVQKFRCGIHVYSDGTVQWCCTLLRGQLHSRSFTSTKQLIVAEDLLLGLHV